MQPPDPYAPLAPLDHPVAAVAVTVAMFALGWIACIGLVFQASAPWDQALVVLPFPGLLQAAWLAPVLAYAATRGWWRFVRAMAAAALALTLANASVLALLGLWLPGGKPF